MSDRLIANTGAPTDQTITPSQQITDAVTSWPGVEAGPGRRGELSFTVRGHEIGHLHGNHAAHFGFPKDLGAQLRADGRVVDHPVFPGKPGPAARRIEDEDDVRDVIELLRLSYERVVARHATDVQVVSEAGTGGPAT